LNLIVNAGEAIPAPAKRKRRQGHVRLWAKPEPDGSSVRLGVTDNGSGMTEEVMRRAFDMFYTTKPRGLGTGLGLAMVRKVIERAGGSVRIESKPAKGTTVVMTLPTAKRANADGGRPSAAIRIGDGRAASIVRNLLEASGAHISGGDDPASTDIWVVEPSPTCLADVKAWRTGRPRGRLVLFGRPGARHAAAWQALQPVTINDRDDLDSIRAALSLAMATH
jgi:Histidine kinase-, DNA gyrase B-, and HSP90-like ATPase